MQFIPLSAMIQQLRAQAGKSVKYTAVDGNQYAFSETVGGSYPMAKMPFYTIGTTSGTSATTSTGIIALHASSASSIPTDTSTILSEIGTTSFTIVKNATGLVFTITVTANSQATINSFIATRYLADSSASSGHQAVLWAVKLDGNGVELNANNNYTASFTLAIEFD